MSIHLFYYVLPLLHIIIWKLVSEVVECNASFVMNYSLYCFDMLNENRFYSTVYHLFITCTCRSISAIHCIYFFPFWCWPIDLFIFKEKGCINVRIVLLMYFMNLQGFKVYNSQYM